MSVPTFAEIARVPEVVPMLGDTLSQAEEFESVLAVKLSAPPPPLLVTFTIAGAGFAPPCTALSETDEVESDRVGGGATVKVTVIVTGEFWAPAAATLMCPVYTAGERVAALAEICTVPGVVPEAEAPSQAESLMVV